MYNQCRLISNFCDEYVDDSNNIDLGHSMMDLAFMLNEILDRYFIPSFTRPVDSGGTHRVGLVDIDPERFRGTNTGIIVSTYRVFKDAYKIDMLKDKRTGKYLALILGIQEGSDIYIY